jgi:hypothetical protein
MKNKLKAIAAKLPHTDIMGAVVIFSIAAAVAIFYPSDWVEEYTKWDQVIVMAGFGLLLLGQSIERKRKEHWRELALKATELCDDLVSSLMRTMHESTERQDDQ